MKNLTNKRYRTQRGEGSQLASEIIEVVFFSPTREGVGGLKDMRMSQKILDKTQSANEGDKIIFEDAEAAYLKNKVVNFQWSYYDRGVHQFTEDVDAMRSCDIPMEAKA